MDPVWTYERRESFRTKPMKTNLRITMAALGVAVLNPCVQGASELNIQTYAGLTVVGEVGKV